MKKSAWILIFIIGIALLVLFKIFMTPKQGPGMQRSASKNSGPGAKAVVSVYLVKPQPVQEKIVSTGTIAADKDIELRSEAAGRIVGIYFKEGSALRKGTLLLKLNDADLQAQLAKTQAGLALAQEREKRQKTLLDKAMISKEDYETAARDLASTQADVQLINAQIDKATLYAPFDGVIGLRTVDEGAYITAGTKIANLVSLKPLKIEFAVPERFVGRISPGSVLTYTIEGSSMLYEATVKALEPKIDESTRTIMVSAFCTNADRQVIPGSFAKVNMIVRENAAALLVPSEALVPDAQGYKVYIVKDSTVSALPVTTGIRTERAVEIVKGLNNGDAVIVSGVLSVRPGMAVYVRKSE